jgi:YVTN family beta-propeller protein
LLSLAFAVGCVLGSTETLRQNAYIAISGSNDVSVIDTATNKVIATIPVGAFPLGIAVTPDGRRVYVANACYGFCGYVSMIDTATNIVIATIPVGYSPSGVAVAPDGGKVYVANALSGTVSVIATKSNTVIDTVTVQKIPHFLAVTRDRGRVYVGNSYSNTVSVIDTVIATNPHGSADPFAGGSYPGAWR